MSAQPKTRNVRGIVHVEYLGMDEKEFRLKVYGSKELVILHLPIWALDCMALDLWKVQRQREKAVAETKRILTSGVP